MIHLREGRHLQLVIGTGWLSGQREEEEEEEKEEEDNENKSISML